MTKYPRAIVLGSPKACNTTSKDKSEDPVAHKSYDNVMNAMLTVPTFAAAITFNIILKPNINGEPAPGLLYLLYANALFCGTIMGCILINVTIELFKNSLYRVDE